MAWYLSIIGPLVIYAYQQFPATRFTIILATVISTPAYFYMAVAIWNAPQMDRHGYISMIVALGLWPIVIGNAVRLTTFYMPPRSTKTLQHSVTAFGVAVMGVGAYVLPLLITKPYELPQLQ